MPELLTKDIVASVSSLHSAARLHGIGTIWGEDCALDRVILSQMVQPQGILSILPAVPTNREIVRYGAITGFRQTSTTEPDYPCENAPRGTYSTCRLQFELGRIKRDTETIEIDKVILRAHQGDEEFALRGALISPNSLGNFSSGVIGQTANPNEVLNNVTLMQMQSMAMLHALELGRMIWAGDPAAAAPANTPNGGKRSFAGFDLLITDTVVDAVSLNACPTMGSVVADFNYANVCTGTLANFGGFAAANIYNVLSQMEWNVYSLAEATNLLPVTWVIVMPQELWHELSRCYPCMYFDGCFDVFGNTGGRAATTFNDDFTVKERDRLRTTMTIPINNRMYPVISDNGIPVLDSGDTGSLTGTQRASSIYFIPLRVLGNTPVTWMRYLDYRRASPERAILSAQGFPLPFVWTDDGKFMLSYQYVNFCYELTSKIEPGLVFRTPQLAFRIDNIMWDTGGFDVPNPYADQPGYNYDLLNEITPGV